MINLVAGGNSEYIVVWDTKDFFNEGNLQRSVFKLPSGFKSVKKVKFLADSNRIAILSEGQLFILLLSQDVLEIDFSIKLPCRAIIDFDIDHLCYYILVVSSEGDVTLYDFQKTKQSEVEITNS
jgi:hypothetical protein